MAKETQINEFGVEEEIVETELAKCPSCGANMVFDPKSQMLFCEHCDTKQSFQSTDASELSLYSALGDDGRDWNDEGTFVYRCDNCGAKVVLSQNQTASTCPFCGTSHVTKIEELAGLKPNGLLPFSLNDDEAIGFSKTWAKKRLFAPRKFKKKMGVDNVKGVYTPCFTFDSFTTSYYQGRIGNRHTRVVGSGKNRRVETYIVWRNISGTFNTSFDDVLIAAGSKVDQQKIDKVAPFATGGGKAFDENFMLGFMAYHYDTDIEECWGGAKSRMDDAIKREILKRYRYDVLDYINVSTRHENVTYKYVMLPVYVGNYTYKKKLYNFYVNGCTGKVTGKTPLSSWKILGTVFLGLAIVAGIALLAYFYLL